MPLLNIQVWDLASICLSNRICLRMTWFNQPDSDEEVPAVPQRKHLTNVPPNAELLAVFGSAMSD